MQVGISSFARLVQAVDGLYSVKSFDGAEFYKAELGLRIGGASLADIMHRAESADGRPGVSTIRRRSQLVQLIASPSYPTLPELSTNLCRSFPEPLRHPESPQSTVGAVLMIDEIAIEKRIRWDFGSNFFLEVCREHGAKNVSLELACEDDGHALLVWLRAEDGCHLASEVSTQSVD